MSRNSDNNLLTDDEDCSIQDKDSHNTNESSEIVEGTIEESSVDDSFSDTQEEKGALKISDASQSSNKSKDQVISASDSLIASDEDVQASHITKQLNESKSTLQNITNIEINLNNNREDEVGKEAPTEQTEKVVATSKQWKSRRSSASFMKIRQSVVESDSDDEIVQIPKQKGKKNVIISSDSDSELSLHSIENNSSEEVEDIAKELYNSRISSEFNFGKKGLIANSTLLEAGSQPGTPTNRLSSKRLLNRSADTPRILKQMKESSTPKNVTPKNAVNAIKNVTPTVLKQKKEDSFMTPRTIQEVRSSSSSSLEVLSENDDIIDISSDEKNVPIRVAPKTPAKKIIKQTTLDSLVTRKQSPVAETPIKKENQVNKIEVSLKEMQGQKEKVRQIEVDLYKAKNLLRTINLSSLPDSGKLLLQRHSSTEQLLRVEAEKLSRMVITKVDDVKTDPSNDGNKISWEEIEAKAGAVLPKTFGKRAMSTYNAQKAVTMDRLHQLHGSLKSCPTEDTLTDDPKGLKVELMPHQKRALVWLMWREEQKPSGGILADDMGLGKTLTMISLMLKTMEKERNDDESDDENRPERSSYKYKGGTLVVCPASLINQWSSELERRTKRGLASYDLYHGPKRETNAKRLAEYDMVITTYSIVMNERDKKGTIFRIKWRRIVMDEGHQIRNYKSQTSEAVCHLAAKSRWALTGTPVHNKELDMYALLKFLRCTPFDDLQVWKRWVGDKSTGGQERLHTVISSLMLRRTKAELMEKGALRCLPERKWELIPVDLNKNEMDIYQRILIFSRTLFTQFLYQRAEKNQDAVDLKYTSLGSQPNEQNQEYFKMRDKLLKMNKVKEIKQHDILVLLLRLRQICCHPSLITGMLHEDIDVDLGDEGESEELNLLDQLNKLGLDEDKHDEYNAPEGLASEEAPGLKEAAKGFLNPSNPVFSKQRASSKIKTMLKVLKEKVLQKNDKAIIVSQWSSFLKLIAFHLEQADVPFDQLDGTVPVHKRMHMVDRFNDPNDKMKVLLLSLTAGGVGLNLVGGNHLFLLDLHWNPQLENQAQDRIYRVGQSKAVYVYKFMATDTIEKRILDLQEKKLDIANSMLTGTKQVIQSKLSLQDLKMLFDM